MVGSVREELMKLYAQLHRELRGRLPTVLQQSHCFQLKLATEALPHALRIDLASFLAHLTPPSEL